MKERLHVLVDELPDGDLAVAQELLEQLRTAGDDAVLRTLLEAPINDETETDEEREAVEEAYADLAAGRVVNHEEIKREFGL